MANFFDQFDPKSEPAKGNYFDQFDPASKTAAPPPEIERAPPKGLQRTTEPEPEWIGAEAAARRQAPYASKFAKDGPVVRALEGLGLGIGSLIGGTATLPQRAIGISERMRTTPQEDPGRFTPQDVGTMMEAATLGAGTPVAGTGRAIAQLATRRDPAAMAAHLGIEVPRGEGFIARYLARRPVVGAPIREAAQETTGQMAAAGERVGAMPAGRAVRSEEAGQLLQNEISAAFREGRLAPHDVSAGRMALAGTPDEALTQLMNLSRGNPAAQAEFSRLRSAVTKKDWETIQGGLITKMGDEAGAFNPVTFAQSWSQMAPQAKIRAFDNGNLYRHLDAIAEVSNRFSAPMAKLSAAPTGGGGLPRALTAGGLALGAVTQPLVTLGAVVGLGAGKAGQAVIARALAKPSSAASIASWSRAYENLVVNPGPGSMAAFTAATRNLNSNLDEDFSVADVLREMRKGLPEVEIKTR